MPDHGSEPAIGWNWALTLARLGNEVLLLCRSTEAPLVEAGLARLPERQRISLIIYDPPWFPTRQKRGHRFIRLHCLIWQIGAYFWLRPKIKELNVQLIQHITWGVFRLPCLLSLLGPPTIFGPVGGGETTPLRLRYKFSLRAHSFEVLRDGLNRLVAFDPLMWLTFSKSMLIAVRTDETRRAIPRRFHRKIFKHTGHTLDRSEVERGPPRPPPVERPLRLLFVGRLVHWKGIYYVVEAFRRFLEKSPDAELTIVGRGSDSLRLRREASKLGIEHRTRWIDRVEHSRLHEVYRVHDVFLFPSLHDSGGMVLLEALASGLPVVALDLGGPGEIVDETCGRLIRTAGRGADEVLNELTATLTEFQKVDLRRRLVSGAYDRAQQFVAEHGVQEFFQRAATVLGRPLLPQSEATPPLEARDPGVADRCSLASTAPS